MNDTTYRAYVVSEQTDGSYQGKVKEKKLSELPEHEVLIRVQYSSLNYKDALSATGNKGVTQNYPHTPGIDAAGIVVESKNSLYKEGDQVIVTSYDLGQNTDGGFGQYIRVPAEWVVPLPEKLNLRESMILGTAGFTAAYGLLKILQTNRQVQEKDILVTGATGGVGSLAISLLAKQGYRVTAATGKMERSSWLKKLGASEIIHRDNVQQVPSRPLLSGKWAGAIETVGGKMLDAVIRQTMHNGTVACCGNILGHTLETSIYPFILRGISLMGIDSGICLMPMRKKIWKLLAEDWKIGLSDHLAKECTLEELGDEIRQILKGAQTGRVLLKL